MTNSDNSILTVLNNINRDIKKVMIIGNYGDGNLGDELILDIIVNDLDGHVKNICVPSKNPDRLLELHGSKINAIHIKSVIKEFFSSDCIIMGGGGIFSKYSGLFIYIAVSLLIFGKLFFRKTIVLYSIGFYSSTPILLKGLIRILSTSADIISVRDEISLKNFKKIGVNKEIFFICDPTIGYIPKKVDTNNIFTKEKINRNKFLIGLSLNYTNNDKIDKLLEIKISDILNSIIRDFDTDIIFFTFCPAFVSKRSDMEMAVSIKSRLLTKKNFKIINYYSPSITINIIENMDFFIAMRYHSKIFSYNMSVPFIGIIYDEKCDEFLRSIKKDGFLLPQLKYDELKPIIMSEYHKKDKL